MEPISNRRTGGSFVYFGGRNEDILKSSTDWKVPLVQTAWRSGNSKVRIREDVENRRSGIEYPVAMKNYDVTCFSLLYKILEKIEPDRLSERLFKKISKFYSNNLTAIREFYNKVKN